MRIFLSYRRSDTQHIAGRITDRLRREKGIGEVFLDVDGITPGEDFQTKIELAIAESEACLILIGPDWLGRTNNGMRIFDDDDFIRLETRVALARCRKVVPVLIEDTAVPIKEDLPEDLHLLPRLNGISIRHLHFDKDIESLLDALHGKKYRSKTHGVPPARTFIGNLFRGFLGLCIAAVGLIGVAITHKLVTGGRSLSESLGGSDQVVLLIIGVLALGAFAPSFLRRFNRRPRNQKK